MGRLNAIRLTEAIKERLIDFSLSHNYLKDPDLQNLCRRFWESSPEQGGLASRIWVEGSIPHLSSNLSLADLVESGHFTAKLAAHLEKRKVFTKEMKLHWHQWQSIVHSVEQENPAIIVSAGTGAGKTESFLLPILNQLSKEERSENGGCRAIILYPMNALVNDQVERVYNWLKGQTKLTLCHFTSETPEDFRAARSQRLPKYENCRFSTRAQARGLEDEDGKETRRGPVPDILITNYSMLEYMLCRPQDSVLFGPDLRAVVLDEAHLYTSTLAAEITILLRRLYQKCGTTALNVSQYATSATIGSGAPEELLEFAGEIFSKPPDRVFVIQGRRSSSTLPASEPPRAEPRPSDLLENAWHDETIVMSTEGKEDLRKDAVSCDELEPLLEKLVSPERVAEARRQSEEFPARLLRVLCYSPIVSRLEELVRERREWPLEKLAEGIWNEHSREAYEATTLLLNLCASARTELKDPPLLPHRLHYLLRPPEGISLCCSPDCPESSVPDLGRAYPHRQERCLTCESLCLALYRCTVCGEALLGADVTAGRLRNPIKFEADRFYSLSGEPNCVINVKKGLESGIGAKGLDCSKCTQCPGCGSESTSFRPVNSPTNLVLSILAETMLAELPALATQHEGTNRFLPAEGRRLLAFSDSRSEAAKLGPRLRHQHEVQLVRAAIVKMFHEHAADPEAQDYYLDEINSLQKKLDSGRVPQSLRAAEESKLEELKAQLSAISAGGSVASWAETLKRQPQIYQLLDDDSGDYHTAENWNQNQWDANARKVKNQAVFLLGRELFRVPRRSLVSVETLGCVEVTFPGLNSVEIPTSWLGSIPDPQARRTLETIWPDLLASLLDTVRYDSAVTLGSEEMDQAWQDADNVPGKWLTKNAFVGKKAVQRRRRFVADVFAKAGISDPEDFVEDFLVATFDTLKERAVEFDTGIREELTENKLPWLETTLREATSGELVDSLRIVFPELGLRKPLKLYTSPVTGHVWCRSVLGLAPDPGGEDLTSTSPAELNETPVLGRYRRDFLSDSPVFKMALWAEEHSAQLSPQQARRRQELFKRGIRNLLSATTTLELGIDIGGLSGAFLSNVPPGLANYLQRAGRVGRRADGSSIVVTCARNRPYDREVFNRVGDFLRKPLKRPLVLLGRERISQRHFQAWLMGRFFEQLYSPDHHAGAMRAFGNMGVFTGRVLPPRWDHAGSARPKLGDPKLPLEGNLRTPDWWTDCPDYGLVVPFQRWLQEVKDRIEEYSPIFERIFYATPLQSSEWSDLVQIAAETFLAGVNQWEQDFDSLLESWHGAEKRAHANSIRYQLRALFDLTVIEAFADARFLPRYGFPIGVHKLRVVDVDQQGRTREEDQYRLERPGLLALREYVPGSQLLVGGKLITSHGLLKHWSGANLDNALGLRGGAAHCKNGHFFYWIGDKDVCPQCQEKPNGQSTRLLFPGHGFTTAAWDPPRRSSNVERIGAVSTNTTGFATRTRGVSLEKDDFSGIPGVRAVYKEDSDILVYNNGEHGKGFAICTKCGYADSERKEGDRLPTRFETHIPLHQSRGKPCWAEGEDPVLRYQNLAAREPTDLLLLDLSGFLGHDAQQESLIHTLAIAFHLAGAKLLELDSRELGHMITKVDNSYGIILYDNVPGGAGHVLELLELGSKWLDQTEQLLYVSSEHDNRCDTACLDCILTFDAQGAFVDVDRGLSRRRALEVVRSLRGAAQREKATPDPFEHLEQEFRDLAPFLPTSTELGYEFFSTAGRGEGQVELAWPEIEVCFALQHQDEGIAAAEARGWKIFEEHQADELKQFLVDRFEQADISSDAGGVALSVR